MHNFYNISNTSCILILIGQVQSMHVWEGVTLTNMNAISFRKIIIMHSIKPGSEHILTFRSLLIIEVRCSQVIYSVAEVTTQMVVIKLFNTIKWYILHLKGLLLIAFLELSSLKAYFILAKFYNRYSKLWVIMLSFICIYICILYKNCDTFLCLNIII